jgi:hypothetical protein
MVDDLRNHDPAPNAEERGWLEFDPLFFAMKLAAVAILGVTIGVYAALLAEPELRSTTAAMEGER